MRAEAHPRSTILAALPNGTALRIEAGDGAFRKPLSIVNKNITSADIRAAMAKPWLAQSIAQLITRHESEWFWNPEKWDELDELMDHSPAGPNPNWLEEKKRIEKLSWWGELVGNME